MISKQKISLIRSLALKKNIYEHKLFVIEGEKLLLEALNTRPDLIVEIFVLNTLEEVWKAKLQSVKAGIQIVNSKEIDQISNLSTPSGILAICRHFDYHFDMEQIKTTTSLYLHEIRDPGNMGTLIRTADWFGIQHILCSTACVDIYNTKVIQATMGSIFRIQIHYIEAAVIKQLSSIVPLVATVMNGSNLYQESKIKNGIIMMGSESHGLPDDLISLSDKRLSIPRSGQSHAESLNVAVAAGIVLSHLVA